MDGFTASRRKTTANSDAAARKQPAMWNSLIQPSQRRSLERPANRDPLVIELQWNRDRHEPERDAADQGQARHVALTRRL